MVTTRANLAIELHDSTLHAVRLEASDAVLETTPYVHASAGRPGVDSGDGWFQRAEIVLSEATLEQHGPTEPLQVEDGTITVEGERFDNLVRLPFDRRGPAHVEVRARAGSFRASASGVRVVLVGPPGPTERFPGSAPWRIPSRRRR